MAQGNGFNAHVSPAISSVLNFDIPPSYKGLTCSLVFLFPARKSLQTSNYTLSGSGGINVIQLLHPATEETTYNTLPATSANIGSIADVQAGSSYVISSGACSAESCTRNVTYIILINNKQAVASLS